MKYNTNQLEYIQLISENVQEFLSIYINRFLFESDIYNYSLDENGIFYKDDCLEIYINVKDEILIVKFYDEIIVKELISIKNLKSSIILYATSEKFNTYLRFKYLKKIISNTCLKYFKDYDKILNLSL